uniref:DUF148 domain-containing protein n=1 Tax=Parastrongyloides trichosuri TaxID=131310 RepID=A0A0N5A2R8_PARTI
MFKFTILLLLVVGATNVSSQESATSLPIPGQPNFLQHATDEAKEQFQQIFANPDVTLGEIKQKTEDIVNGQSDEVKNAYNEAKAKTEEMEAEFKANLTAKGDALSEEAKPYFIQIRDVFENMDEPLSHIPGDISRIVSQVTDPSIKAEIAAAFPVGIITQNEPTSGQVAQDPLIPN